MQRFRTMQAYSALLIGYLLIMVAAVAMHRASMTPQADAEPSEAPLAVTQQTKSPASVPTDAGREFKVSIEEFAFKPAELAVPAGATVTWVNHDDVPHTATGRDSPRAFDSKVIDTDGTYSFTFSKPGTYEYFCKVHPHMIAKVKVN